VAIHFAAEIVRIPSDTRNGRSDLIDREAAIEAVMRLKKAVG
jgi:hypothetical protein